MSGAFCDGFNIGFRIFNIEDAFILFLSELKGALCCDSASISFAVEYMSRQRDGGIVPVNGHVSAMC